MRAWTTPFVVYRTVAGWKPALHFGFFPRVAAAPGRGTGVSPVRCEDWRAVRLGRRWLGGV